MILIFDCNSICYRSWFKLNLTHEEREIGVIFGFLNQVLTITEKLKRNDDMIFLFCFDSKINYRREIFHDYKMRVTTEEINDREPLYNQIDELRTEILPQLGFRNIFMKDGFESDDLIAYFALECDQIYDRYKVIVSNDSDLYQLISDHTAVFNYKDIITKKRFTTKYKIEPREFAEVKAIAGCTTDTVNGISGVGEATAIKYLRNELKDGKKKQAIESKRGQRLIARNRRLVKLPFIHDTEFINYNVRDEDLIYQDFEDVFESLDFRFFMKDKNMRRWEDAFCLTF